MARRNYKYGTTHIVTSKTNSNDYAQMSVNANNGKVYLYLSHSNRWLLLIHTTLKGMYEDEHSITREL